MISKRNFSEWFLKHFRKEQKNIYVLIHKNKELIHVLIPLSNNVINSFIHSSKKESIPGIISLGTHIP